MGLGTMDEPATERAARALAGLGVLAEDAAQRRRLVNRIELYLWHFLRLRWPDAHEFFSSVESIEALQLVKEGFAPGRVLQFFSERQDDAEWENCITVGLALVFAAARQALSRGFDPKTAGVFTMQRMLEQALDVVSSLEELLELGAPPG